MKVHGWKTLPFESAVRSRGSGNAGLPQKEWEDGGRFPVIGQGAEDIEGRTNRKDLLLTPSPAFVLYGGHTRRAKYVSQPFVPGPNVKILQPISELDSKFLFYFLTHLPIESKGYADHFPLVRKCEIPVPPLAEQQRIVGVLDEAFAGLATAQAHAAQNLQNARALFESHLQSVFTHRGEGWAEKTMEELIESSLIGLTRSSKEQGDEKLYPYVKMNHITRDNRFEFTDYLRVDATNEEAERFALEEGDFLFNTRNSHELVGKSCIYTSAVEGLVLFNNNIMRIRFKPSINARCVLAALSSRSVAEELEGLKSGTTNVSAIYFKDLRNLRVPLPPSAEQKRIAEKLDALATETQKLARLYEQKLAALAELKKSLLHQAFSGEL